MFQSPEIHSMCHEFKLIKNGQLKKKYGRQGDRISLGKNVAKLYDRGQDRPKF
jgi:hypothetical protein